MRHARHVDHEGEDNHEKTCWIQGECESENYLIRATDMHLPKKLILLIGLFAFNAAFAGNACNMNGDWYTSPNVPDIMHFKQTGDLVEGNVDAVSSSCTLLITGMTGENEINFRMFFSGDNCPDYYSDYKGQFSQDCTFLTGSLTIAGASIEPIPVTMYRVPIKIVEPENDKELIITAEPQMPDLTFKARLLSQPGLDANIPPFTWGINFKSIIFQYLVAANEIETVDGLFKPSFENLIDLGNSDYPGRPIKGNVMGGELKVSVTFYKNLHDEKTYLIKGTNPGQLEIESVIADKALRQIACQESRYKQFDARREGGIGMPLIGYSEDGVKGGVGIMQLYRPKPNPEQVWNWRENIKAGKVLYEEKYYAALAWPKTELTLVNKKREKVGLPACKTLPLLNNEQLMKETIRRYNCGVEYRWEPWDEPSCKGQWVVNPSCKIKNSGSDEDYVDKVLACDINK
jgi:hypothetical protein